MVVCIMQTSCQSFLFITIAIKYKFLEYGFRGHTTRIILSCTDKGDWILDPFSGSSTTGIAANLCDRKFAGIEQSDEFCQMSRARREEFDLVGVKADWKRHIVDFKVLKSLGELNFMDGEEFDGDSVSENTDLQYGLLPFDTKPL